MNTQPTETFHTKLTQHVCLAAALVSCLMILPGCGIPTSRGPLPGPTMPQFYSWNNGAGFLNYETIEEAPDSADEVAGADEKATRPKGLFRDIKLVSFLKGSTSIDAEAADAPQDRASTNESESDKIESCKLVNTVAVAALDETSHVPPMPLPAYPSIDSDAMVIELDSSSQIPVNAFFDDPFLVSLIYEALAGNQELRILAEEINISCNEVYARSGEYRPFVTLGAGAGVDKSSSFSRNGAVEEGLLVAPGRSFPEPLPDFLVATNISWELDIWKKLRNAQKAASMRYLGTTEGRNYIVTRMVAEVADNYYELLSLDNRLITLDKTIEIQEQSLIVAQRKKDAGEGDILPVQRFQAEVRKNQSERLIILQEIVEVENRINFLLGRYPQPVERISVEYVDLNLNALSAGLPSKLLQNRADIRQAERNVAAAGLDVKVAKARFYPSLGLSAGVGLNAYNMKYLFSTPESLIYNAAVDLVGPLINKRAIKADYCSANAAQLQAIYEYQKTVLTAHIEVVNHMTKVENYRQSIEVKKDQLKSLEASVLTASRLFQVDRAEYIEVLLAQRELMEAKMKLIEIKQQQLGAIVNAYQALGGGGF